MDRPRSSFSLRSSRFAARITRLPSRSRRSRSFGLCVVKPELRDDGPFPSLVPTLRVHSSLRSGGSIVPTQSVGTRGNACARATQSGATRGTPTGSRIPFVCRGVAGRAVGAGPRACPLSGGRRAILGGHRGPPLRTSHAMYGRRKAGPRAGGGGHVWALPGMRNAGARGSGTSVLGLDISLSRWLKPSRGGGRPRRRAGRRRRRPRGACGRCAAWRW